MWFKKPSKDNCYYDTTTLGDAFGYECAHPKLIAEAVVTDTKALEAKKATQDGRRPSSGYDFDLGIGA